jgi:hypothetical protein
MSIGAVTVQFPQLAVSLGWAADQVIEVTDLWNETPPQAILSVALSHHSFTILPDKVAQGGLLILVLTWSEPDDRDN